MKAVLISIQPKWCELIANGKKTVEVRKTKPKIETPFKVYIYCTNNKRQWLRKLGTSFQEIFITENRDVLGRTEKVKSLIGEDATFWENGGYNGKVIGEFVCDEIIELAPINRADEDIEKQTCLSRERIVEYLRGKGCGWHISNLVIYDKPKELSEFETKRTITTLTTEYNIEGIVHYPKKEIVFDKLIRPPQSWYYVEAL